MTDQVVLTTANTDQIVDRLIYLSYSHNRKLAPEITPERWAKVFGPTTPVMEEQFQREEVAARNASQTEDLRNSEGDESALELDGSDDGLGLEPHQR